MPTEPALSRESGRRAWFSLAGFVEGETRVGTETGKWGLLCGRCVWGLLFTSGRLSNRRSGDAPSSLGIPRSGAFSGAFSGGSQPWRRGEGARVEAEPALWGCRSWRVGPGRSLEGRAASREPPAVPTPRPGAQHPPARRGPGAAEELRQQRPGREEARRAHAQTARGGECRPWRGVAPDV